MSVLEKTQATDQLLDAKRLESTVMTSYTDSQSAPLARFNAAMRSPKTFDFLAICMLFFGFAGQGIRNIVGFRGSGVVMVILFVFFAWSWKASGGAVGMRPKPVTTLLFVLACALSTSWSVFPAYTAVAAIVTCGVTAVGLALAQHRTIEQIVDLLIRAFEAILITSYIFELFVAFVWRKKFPPLTMLEEDKVPNLLNWSQNALLSGGPIQGFMGNRNPLAFVALLLLLCLLVRWLVRRERSWETLGFSALSLLTLALTRSGTVTVCLVACLIASGAFLLVAGSPQRARPNVVLGLFGLALTLVTLALFAHRYVTTLLGKSPDMTGRVDIWRALIPLWKEHPLLGWGWAIGYPTELPTFAHFIPREDGTPTTQAHNAYVEALFLTGVLGLILIVCVTLILLFGTYLIGVQRIDVDRFMILPALLATALVVQSTVESRFLYEGNWMLVVILSAYVASRQPFLEHRLKHGGVFPFRAANRLSLPVGA